MPKRKDPPGLHDCHHPDWDHKKIAKLPDSAFERTTDPYGNPTGQFGYARITCSVCGHMVIATREFA